MAKRRHKQDTKTAEELLFAEAAKSLTANLNNLLALIKLHVRKSPRQAHTKQKVRRQVRRFVQRVRAVT